MASFFLYGSRIAEVISYTSNVLWFENIFHIEDAVAEHHVFRSRHTQILFWGSFCLRQVDVVCHVLWHETLHLAHSNHLDWLPAISVFDLVQLYFIHIARSMRASIVAFINYFIIHNKKFALCKPFSCQLVIVQYARFTDLDLSCISIVNWKRLHLRVTCHTPHVMLNVSL